MHTFADLAKALNRSTVYLSGLQSRLELSRPLRGHDLRFTLRFSVIGAFAPTGSALLRR